MGKQQAIDIEREKTTSEAFHQALGGHGVGLAQCHFSQLAILKG